MKNLLCFTKVINMHFAITVSCNQHVFLIHDKVISLCHLYFCLKYFFIITLLEYFNKLFLSIFVQFLVLYSNINSVEVLALLNCFNNSVLDYFDFDFSCAFKFEVSCHFCNLDFSLVNASVKGVCVWVN